MDTEIESPHLVRGEGFFMGPIDTEGGGKGSLGKALEISLPDLPTQVIISHLQGEGGDHLFLRVFGFVEASFDLADLLGDRNLFGTNFGTLP